MPKSPTASAGLAHRTMAAATADALRQRILDGDFPSGFQLRQDALADEFGVSRIPVREALVQLEAEGLVKILPHKGAVVVELSLDEIAELFELRAVLEPHILKLSAPHFDAEDFRRIGAIVQDYGSELRAGHVTRWGDLNTRFHLALYERAGRPRTFALVENLLKSCDRLTRLQLVNTSGGRERAEAEHAEILRLCQIGAFDAAGALLAAHVSFAGKALVDFLAGQRKK